MTRTFIASALAAALLVGAGAPAARAQDVKTTARATAAKIGKAIVTVKLVLKIKGAGQEQEVKSETIGTVIDPSGLTMVVASSVDPLVGRRARAGGQIEVDVSEASLILDDGTEVESDVVLKDEDANVAFIRPRDTTLKLEAVTLKARGTPLQPLEDVFVMGRMGRLENRANSLVTGTVRGVVKGPKTFYILSNEAVDGNQGCVAFDAAGNTLGVIVTKVDDSAAGGGGGAGARGGRGGRGGGGGGGGGATILRPIEDILELAAQAKTAKVPEKKVEAADEDAPKAATGTAVPAPLKEKAKDEAKPAK